MTEVCRLPYGYRLMASENGHDVAIDRGYLPFINPRDMRYLPSARVIQKALVDQIAQIESDARERGRPFMQDPRWLAIGNAAVLINAEVPSRVRRYVEEVVSWPTQL